MKRTLLLFVVLAGLGSGLWAQGKFYSRQGGAWNVAATWSADPSGNPASLVSPGANDTVVIRHTVTHACGKNYTHFGDVRIELEGIYIINSGSGQSDPYNFAGNLFSVLGAVVTSSDFQNQLPFTSGPNGTGTFYAGPQAYIEFGDDFILNSFSTTVVDNPACGKGSTADDVYFKGTNARLCGSGKLFVPDALRAWNNSNVEQASPLTQIANQVCAGFAIYSDSNNCDAGVNPILTGSGPFPVEWLSVDAIREGSEVRIEWVTASEQNNWFFTVERSTDGTEYEAVGDVPAVGNSQAATAYQLSDAQPFVGRNLYRIRQTDFDGQHAFSPSTEIWMGGGGLQIKVLKSTSGTELHAFNLAAFDAVQVRLSDMQGREVGRMDAQADISGQMKVLVGENMASGVLIARIITRSGQSGVVRLVHP